ncbi:oxidative stress defense protein [uncultured Shewanella sp.]|uniref:oxidative stress defense protein n=1 Tax=uncultured Shewanella sp. TaxID=173975 RepID=UPI002607D80E|nr:oxidative stress defense protein [uncultured Shewanella sp.]
MKKSLLAALISAGLILSTPQLQASELNFPHLETVGVSEVAVEADMAEIDVAVVIKDKTAKAAKEGSDRAVAKFIARLKSAGIERSLIQSANLNLQPQYHYEKDKPAELIGYTASRRLTVTVKELTRLNAILDSALEEGLNRVNNIALKSSKEEELIAKARQAAIKDAQAKAQLLAEGFGEKIKGVWEIRYYEQHPVQPVMLRMSAKGASYDVGESYQQGHVTIRDRVEVIYRLK